MLIVDFQGKGSSNAWFLARGGYLFSTEDSGESWKKVSSVSAYFLIAFNFIDNENGFAITSAGDVLSTKDNGRSWVKISSLHEVDPALITQLRFFDKKYGWVISKNCVLISNDGGFHWEKSSVALVDNQREVEFFDCSILSQDVGIISSNQGNIYLTEDSGKTWQCINICQESADWSEIRFTDSKFGWVTNRSVSNIYVTENAGAKWGKFSLPFPEDELSIVSVFFVNPEVAWIAGHISHDALERSGLPINRFGSGIVLRTVDKGKSWQPVKIDEKEAVFDRIEFTDLTHGWLIGRNYLYMTKDGGHTWAKKLKL
jgi:photosystem II stability/assembly factor-like uncharacterized protein